MIYSEDDLLDAVKERVRRSPSLADRVRLIGAVPHDQMTTFYSAADLFVVGSHHEGSGYALMEACACGAVPVVTGSRCNAYGARETCADACPPTGNIDSNGPPPMGA